MAMACRLSQTTVHSFPSSEDMDQNPYVFDMCCNSEDLLAVSACGPGHIIKVYDKLSLKCVAQLAGHTAKVNELHFAPAGVNTLYSASNDGSLRLWDVRAPKPLVHSFTTGGKEIWSAGMSVDSNMIAAGVEYTLRTWDLRTRKLYRSYVDAHTDDVTCVCAHPLQPSVFLTGSEDGLMCAINNASDDIDDAIEAVFNVNVAISRVGFVGSKAQQAYALSNVHGLQLWNLGAEEILVDIDDLRPACSQAVSCQMDYVIDCKYDADKDALYVVAGSDVGHVAAYQLAPGIGPIAVMAAFEANAHSQVVRTFEWETRSGHFWSGGEDCKVCLWEVAGGGRGGGATAAAAATESACAMPPVVGFPTTASGVKMEMEGGDDEEEKVEEVVEWGYEMVKKSEEDMWASWKGPSDGLDLRVRGAVDLEEVVKTIRTDTSWRDASRQESRGASYGESGPVATGTGLKGQMVDLESSPIPVVVTPATAPVTATTEKAARTPSKAQDNPSTAPATTALAASRDVAEMDFGKPLCAAQPPGTTQKLGLGACSNGSIGLLGSNSANGSSGFNGFNGFNAPNSLFSFSKPVGQPDVAAFISGLGSSGAPAPPAPPAPSLFSFSQSSPAASSVTAHGLLSASKPAPAGPAAPSVTPSLFSFTNSVGAPDVASFVSSLGLTGSKQQSSKFGASLTPSAAESRSVTKRELGSPPGEGAHGGEFVRQKKRSRGEGEGCGGVPASRCGWQMMPPRVGWGSVRIGFGRNWWSVPCRGGYLIAKRRRRRMG